MSSAEKKQTKRKSGSFFVKVSPYRQGRQLRVRRASLSPHRRSDRSRRRSLRRLPRSIAALCARADRPGSLPRQPGRWWGKATGQRRDTAARLCFAERTVPGDWAVRRAAEWSLRREDTGMKLLLQTTGAQPEVLEFDNGLVNVI